MSTVGGGCLGAGLVFLSRPSVAASAWSGRYVFTGGKRQEERRREAIEKVVQEVNVLIRGLARERITEGTAPNTPLDMHVDPAANEAWLVAPRMPRIQGPISGVPFRWKSAEGDRNVVSFTWSEDVLVTRFRGDGADSRYEYRFNPDEGAMTLSAVIRHRLMPLPLRFRQSYRRIR